MKTLKCPSMNEWVKIGVLVCVGAGRGNGIFRHKNEILTFVTEWLDLEGIAPSEMSQREKERYFVKSLICEIK